MDQLGSAWEGLNTRRQFPWGHLADGPPYKDSRGDRGWWGLEEDMEGRVGHL